ncbi:MAG: DoxX family protein [Candidatus Campbellbacteria bacterium]|nr:DoxX family protein [Candidatus Campbellbacteria bacterium]
MIDLIPLASMSDLVLLVVRIIAGVTMIYYGWPKIKDLKANARDFESMGFKPGMLHGTLVAIVEFFGGIAVVLGFFTWAAALAFGFEMIMGALYKITKTDKPFTDWSYDLLLLAIMLVLLAFGPGKIALSALF